MGKTGEVRAGQSPLANLASIRMVILFNLMRRSGIVVQRRDFGLSEIEWRIMTQIGEYSPLSLNGLADRMMQDRGQLSRAVKGMVANGLLTRVRKPGGPEIQIGFTEEGTRLYARMVEKAIEREAFLTEGVSAEDLATVQRVLEHMIARAGAMLPAEASAEPSMETAQ